MRTAILLSILSMVVCIPLQAQDSSPVSKGEALFNQQDWAGAAHQFKLATEQNQEDGHAWFRLGSSLYRTGAFAESAMAFRHAAEAHSQTPLALAAAGRAYAAANQPAEALVWLEKAADAGFFQISIFDSAPTMISLKSRPEFAGVMEKIGKNSAPCENSPEYKEFDFWLGEWDVQVAGQTVARSRIEKIDDGCVIQENWMPFSNPGGKSWNFYDASTGKWEQLWLSGGTILRLQGKKTDGAMAFQGTTVQPNAHSIQERLTFTPLAAGSVHQFWEQSRDDGKTWTVAFDGVYIPHKPDTLKK